MTRNSDSRDKNQIVSSSGKETKVDRIASPRDGGDGNSIQEVRTPARWHHPWNFEDYFCDNFKALDRISEQLGFPSMFSNRWLSRDEFGFGNHLSRFMREFDGFRRDSSSFFGHHDNRISEYTQKLFDEMATPKNHEDGNRDDFPPLDPSDDLLCHQKELEDLYNKYKSEMKEHDGNSMVTGRSYVSSTINRNGKAVTVSKHSELTPDGKIKTRIDQKYKDREGHNQSRGWEKCLDLNSNQEKMLENKL